MTFESRAVWVQRDFIYDVRLHCLRSSNVYAEALSTNSKFKDAENKLQMVGHCAFHYVSESYLALGCVVLFLESRTGTARSFVSMPALWILSSWILPRPGMCAFASLFSPPQPPPLTFKRYNLMKLHPCDRGPTAVDHVAFVLHPRTLLLVVWVHA